MKIGAAAVDSSQDTYAFCLFLSPPGSSPVSSIGKILHLCLLHACTICSPSPNPKGPGQEFSPYVPSLPPYLLVCWVGLA